MRQDAFQQLGCFAERNRTLGLLGGLETGADGLVRPSRFQKMARDGHGAAACRGERIGGS